MRAKKLYEELKKKSGPYPDWSASTKDFVFETLENSGNTHFSSFIKNLYGYEAHDYYNPLSNLMLLHKEYCFDPTELISIEKMTFGILPRIVRKNPVTGEITTDKSPNAFAILADEETYLICFSTQFYKIIEDFSIISTSVSRNPSFHFNIPLEKIPESFMKLIELRWIREETPPSWELNYMPEDVQKSQDWQFRSKILMFTIQSFFMFHEIEHILNNHFNRNPNDNFYVNDVKVSVSEKILHDEYEADRKATRRLIRLICNLKETLKEIDKEAVREYTLFLVSGVIQFFSFMSVMDGYSNSNFDSHPPSKERSEEIKNIFLNSELELDDLLINLVSDSFNKTMISIGKKIRSNGI